MRVAMFAPPISRPFLEARLHQMEGIDFSSAPNEAEAIAALADAEVFVMPQQYTTPTLAAGLVAAPKLKWIQLLTAGTEIMAANLQLPEGVLLTSGTGGLAPTVAEHAVALLLALARKLPETFEHQAAAQWHAPIKERMVSLYGKSVAVVGFGAIGQEIAKRLTVFGVRVLGVSNRGAANALAAEMRPARELDGALAAAEMVVLALPLTTATHTMFDEARLRSCRPGTLLVNVGRGKVIDSSALAAVLAEGHLGGAALDVTDPEPLPSDHLLWKAPNLIITPHCAAGGGYPKLADFVAENIQRYIMGTPPEFPILLPQP